jgi:class 3 adenylate cyclase/tetratricopeptide (TPR) repeat protein
MTVPTCAACGGAVPEGARFCPTCGRPLVSGDAEERKLATVLFADLAGSTELAARMDAEALRSLLAEVFEELSRSAIAHGGTVEKFIGDAVMAVFGVPVTHEDDPERAVRAALAMRSRMEAIAARRSLQVVLRIGINTGVVVTGVTPGRDFLVTGEAVNLAARLQQAAEPGEVLVGEPTFRLVRSLVRTVRPRSVIVKGRAEALPAYAVEHVAPATAYRRRRALGPFVGRDRELELIRSLWDRAVERRQIQMITLIGEPGIGKSRLAEEAVIELQNHVEPPSVWVGRCRPYGEGGPYVPLAEVLRRAMGGGAPDAGPDRLRAELRGLLGDDAEDVIDDVLRTAGLGGEVPQEEEEHESTGREGWRTVLVELARRSPVLLVLEDAHWAEPALLDLVESLVAGATRVPLVVLCLARDDLLLARPGWGAGVRNSTVWTLDSLADGDMQRLSEALAADREKPAEVVALAEGNPFFLEEILAMAGESGGGHVPATLRGVIAARLDLLEPAEKRLLQRASVIGRSFGFDLLAAVSGEGPDQKLLRQLYRRDLVSPRGSDWSFKHMLIRDVAYESMPRRERARLHLEVARQLEQSDSAGPEVVANHYAAAVGYGAADARADAVRLLLESARHARGIYARGLALRQANLALSTASHDAERALAYEAIGDAQWMSQALDESSEAYEQALHHAAAAGADPAQMARLRWKWVDLPTRWGAMLRTPPDPDLLEHEIELGLADARTAGARATEARLLIARALLVWCFQTGDEVQRAALRLADQAIEIARELGRPLIESAALDARGVILHALHRYREALEADTRRLALIPRLASRAEQLDACAAAARTRTVLGDFAGAVEVADQAYQLASGGDDHWLAWPALSRLEAYFQWDRWDEAMRAYESFLTVFRGDGRSRRPGVPSRALGVAAAVHVLHGEMEQADVLEQRLSSRSEAGFHLPVAHALLGAGQPALALDRLAQVKQSRLWVLGISAEARAMLGDWDGLDETLARAEATEGLGEVPRLGAQLDRARGIAGDRMAMERAAAGFERLGCRFEHARCLELLGRGDAARHVYRRLGATPALASVG